MHKVSDLNCPAVAPGPTGRMRLDFPKAGNKEKTTTAESTTSIMSVSSSQKNFTNKGFVSVGLVMN